LCKANETTAEKDQGVIIVGSSKKQKVVPVTRAKMVQAFAVLTDVACSTKGKPEISAVILASILQL
jgi:hypothetical protein